jgi:RNA recognition motif-containing protein
MRTVLHVGNLRSHADVRELERLFSSHGVVRRADVFQSEDMFNRHGGFGIVQMGSQEEATAAIASLDGAVVCETVVAVRWATTREQTGSGHPRMFSSMNMADGSNGDTCQ